MKGCNQSVVWWYTHLITDSVLAVHVTMVLICNLKKMKVFSRHWVSFFCVPALSPTCFRYIFCNHFVFENATNFCFLTMLLEKQIKINKKLSMLLKEKRKNAWSWWTHTTKTSLQSWQGCQPADTARKGLWRNSSLQQGVIIPESLQPKVALAGRNEHRTEL